MSQPGAVLYPWKRFWCPWDKSISFADDGFVFDPESDYGILLNPDLTTLDAIVEERCVILLGEPGLGKSQTLREHQVVLASGNDSSRGVMFFDLKDFGSDTALSRVLFDSETFQAWKKGNSRLYLLLDSFDEGLLTIESLSGYLIRELRTLADRQPIQAALAKSLTSSGISGIQEGADNVSSTTTGENRPLERLYLRIACRSATWPQSLTAGLREIFSQQTVSLLRLAPLRKSDVEVAAQRTGASNFVREVVARGVVPFATKPITLKPLLSLYLSNQALPSSRREIYEKLCLVACTESNRSRQERSKTGRLTPEERVSIARRVAALTVFCNRGRLRTDLPLESPEDEELGLDAVSGVERYGNHEVRVDFQALAETFDTPLFTWPKSQCVAWDHRTYSEFLAAEYCHVHGITKKQLLPLIFTTAFGERRIAPQLYETAAWLCTFYRGLVFDALASDPFVLLQSDVLKDDQSIRYKVTERYLESFEKERVFDDRMHEELRMLQHPNLAGQLRRYISERTKKDWARRKAMDIAAECVVRELEPDLVRVALDSRESLPIRTHVLFTLDRFATPASRARLRGLVTKPVPEDHDDELRGWALMATWPQHISAAELFAAITSPGSPTFVGGYTSFLNKLSRDIPATLKEEDLDIALDWAEKLDVDRHNSNRLTAVADAILIRAWDSLQNPAVLDRFSRIVLKRVADHVPIAQSDYVYRVGKQHRFHELLTADTARRRLLIASLIRLLATGDATFPPFLLLFSADGIVRTNDTEWLIDQIRTSATEQDAVIHQLLDKMPSDAESLGALRAAIDTGRLPSQYDTRLYVQLSSELAGTLKRQYEESTPRRERKLLVPSPSKRVSELLLRIRDGHSEAWSGLTRELTLEEYSEFYGEEGDDIRKLPGWLAADSSTRADIVLAAKQFVREYIPTPTEYSQQTFGHWIIAAYLAFALLYDEDISFLESQHEQFWNRWAGLLLSYRFDSTRGVGQKLLSMIAKRSPNATVAGLAEVLGPTLDDCYFLNKLSDAWIPQVEEYLIQSLQGGGLKRQCFDVILAFLLEKGSLEAEDFAISMTRQVSDPDSQVRGAVALLKHSTGKSQDVVWPLIRSSDTVGEKIVEAASDAWGNLKFVQDWSDETIGELYVWIAKRYPYSETTERTGGAYSVGTAEMVAYSRDSLLNHLRNRGTEASVAALERAGKELGAAWMKWHVTDAKNVAFRRAWQPVSPFYVLSLAENAESPASREVGYRTAAALVVLLSFLGSLLVPIQLSGPDRAFLTAAVMLAALALLEKANRRRSLWFPFWIFFGGAEVVAYLMFRFFGGK